MNSNFCRLEFNESQQHFHIEAMDENCREPNTHGWKTVSEDDEFILWLFINFAEKNLENPVSFQTIKDNWTNYINHLHRRFYFYQCTN